MAAQARGREEEEGMVLMIEGLTRSVHDNHLEEIFGNYGAVVDASVERDRGTGLSKGFGHVSFAKRIEAEQAQQYLDGAQIDGNIVKVNLVLFNRRRRSSPPRGRDRSRRSPSPRRTSRDRMISSRSTRHNQSPYRRDRRYSSRSRSRSRARPRSRSRSRSEPGRRDRHRRTRGGRRSESPSPSRSTSSRGSSESRSTHSSRSWSAERK